MDKFVEKKASKAKKRKADTKDEPKPKLEESKATGSFPLFNDWIAELGDWREPLKAFVEGPKMKSLYEFVKKEYSETTVSS
jgi:hypothetical protein